MCVCVTGQGSKVGGSVEGARAPTYHFTRQAGKQPGKVLPVQVEMMDESDAANIHEHPACFVTGLDVLPVFGSVLPGVWVCVVGCGGGVVGIIFELLGTWAGRLSLSNKRWLVVAFRRGKKPPSLVLRLLFCDLRDTPCLSSFPPCILSLLVSAQSRRQAPHAV